MVTNDPNRSYGAATRAPRTAPQVLTLIVGIVYTLIGVVGFFVTGFDNFAGHEGELLLGFEVNPLHNIVHVLVGVLGLALSARLATARTFGWLLFIAYGVVFVYGLIVDKESDANFLALNGADDVLHLVSAAVGLVIALLPVRRSLAPGDRRSGAYSSGDRTDLP
jgi:hypothetical protein